VRVLLVVIVLVVASARASADTIALVSNDAALRTALIDAGESVTVTAESAPGVSELASSSRAIADRLGASVTVWLIPAKSTASLVTYDRALDRVIVRELPYAPPLDAARATEAARIVRTMLRSIRAPDDDGTRASGSTTTGPGLATATGATNAANGIGVGGVGATGAGAGLGVGVGGGVREPEPRFSIGAGGGVWIAAPGAIANVAVTLTTAWRPHGLGVALQATLAPAPQIAMSAFTGDVQDVVVAAVARNAMQLPGAGNVRLVPAAGMSLHMLHLKGNTAESRRFDPAIRVGLAALRGLPHQLEAGLDVSADCLLLRQKYEAGNQEILAVPRVQILAAVVIGIRL
jgi:hypothetical protein